MNNETTTGRPYRVRVAQSSDKNFWYNGKKGKRFTVKEMSWNSAYVECQENGNSMLKTDLDPIAKKRRETEEFRNTLRNREVVARNRQN